MFVRSKINYAVQSCKWVIVNFWIWKHDYQPEAGGLEENIPSGIRLNPRTTVLVPRPLDQRLLYSVPFRKVLYLVLRIIITNVLKFGYLKIGFREMLNSKPAANENSSSQYKLIISLLTQLFVSIQCWWVVNDDLCIYKGLSNFGKNAPIVSRYSEDCKIRWEKLFLKILSFSWSKSTLKLGYRWPFYMDRLVKCSTAIHNMFFWKQAVDLVEKVSG